LLSPFATLGFNGNADMETISIPNGTLEYVEVGDGIPLIMLHGGSGSIEEWGDCIDYFATQYRVIAYNRRGYGNSTPRDTFLPNFHSEDAEDLLAFLDILGLDYPVLLCGFSDGATIALLFAAEFPERVRAMVCAGGHIYTDDKTHEGLLRARSLFEACIKRDELDEQLPQIRSQRAWFDLWLDPDFKRFSIEDKMSQVRCPTLVIQGSEDEYAGADHAHRIADGIEDSRLCLINGARHWIHGGKCADEFKKEVMTFLAVK